MCTQTATVADITPAIARHLRTHHSLHLMTGEKVTMPPRKTGTTAVLEADPWLYIQDVSDLTEIPVASLRYLRANGEGPPFTKVGRKLRIRRSEALTWFREKYETADQ